MSLLGIDLGTSGVRAACYDASGAFLVAFSHPLQLTRTGIDRVEVDAEVVLTVTEQLIAQVVAAPALLDDAVEALSFSVQGEAVVPVGMHGRALAAAPVSLDRRGSLAANDLSDRVGRERVQHITGQPLHPMFSIYKIASGGEGWSGTRVQRYLCLDAFVSSRLGGDAATDYSMAARTGAFNVGDLTWSSEILEASSMFAGFKITPDLLPRVVPPGTVIGTVSESVCARTGLSAGVSIVSGVHDQAASFLGAGGRVGETSVLALGSSDCLSVATSGRPDFSADTGFASYPLDEELWVTLAGTAAGGWTLEWLATIFGDGVEEIFGHPAAQPPSLLVLPYFAGSGTLDNDPLARGVIAGLTLSTTRGELARAVLESTGFELARMLDALVACSVETGSIAVVGSGAANRTATDIRSSAAGVALHPLTGHTSARGAAMLGGVGIGFFDGIGALPPLSADHASVPDPAQQIWYARQRRAFRDLYSSTLPTMHSLANTERITHEQL